MVIRNKHLKKCFFKLLYYDNLFFFNVFIGQVYPLHTLIPIELFVVIFHINFKVPVTF